MAHLKIISILLTGPNLKFNGFKIEFWVKMAKYEDINHTSRTDRIQASALADGS